MEREDGHWVACHFADEAEAFRQAGREEKTWEAARRAASHERGNECSVDPASERRTADPGGPQSHQGLSRSGPVCSHQLFQRGDGHAIRAVDDVSFDTRCGRSAGHRRRERLRQVHDRPYGAQAAWSRRAARSASWENAVPRGGRALLRFRRQAQMIFQDPYQSLNPRFTIFDSVAEPLIIHGLARGPDLRRRGDRDAGTGGASPAGRPSSTASRTSSAAASASAWRSPARWCFAPDSSSPTSRSRCSMCPSARASCGSCARFSRDFGLSVIYISHDISTVRFLCDRTAVMYIGRIVEIGATSSVLDEPKHPYTKALLAAVPRIRPAPPDRASRSPAMCRAPPAARPAASSIRAAPRSSQPCASVVPRQIPLGDGHEVACHLYDHRFTHPAAAEGPRS